MNEHDWYDVDERDAMILRTAQRLCEQGAAGNDAEAIAHEVNFQHAHTMRLPDLLRTRRVESHHVRAAMKTPEGLRRFRRTCSPAGRIEWSTR
jgi:hypothetical protein